MIRYKYYEVSAIDSYGSSRIAFKVHVLDTPVRGATKNPYQGEESDGDKEVFIQCVGSISKKWSRNKILANPELVFGCRRDSS